MPKYKVEKTAHVMMTLNSSEMIMFTKGGAHKIVLPANTFEDMDNIEILVQMAREDQSKYDWITSEADKHKQRVNEE